RPRRVERLNSVVRESIANDRPPSEVKTPFNGYFLAIDRNGAKKPAIIVIALSSDVAKQRSSE
ncbi:MAG TPA: hypothetical protein VGC50_10615, partial [Gammaproteobacteria bacterium]